MRFLNDLSIQIKVLIPPAIFVVALVVVALMGIYSMHQQHTALETINEIAMTKIRVVDEFVTLSEQVQSDVFQIFVLRSMNLPQSEIQPINARLQQGLSNLNVAYGEMFTRWQLDPAERAILERMKPPMDAFRLQAQQAAITVADNPSFGVLLVRSSGVSFAEFRKTLVELQDYQKAKVVRLAGETEQSTRTLGSVIIVFAFLITLGALVVTTQMSTRLISQPIRSITQVMRQLASGDLTVKVGDLNRRDEIGAMTKAVEVFRNDAIEKARLDKELRESEERFRALIENSADVIALFTGEGIILYESPSVRQILGYSPDELVGHNGFEFMHPDDYAACQELFGKLIQSPQTPAKIEFRHKRKDGTWAWVQVTGTNLLTKPSVKALVVNYFDITERKRTEEMLRESEERFRTLFEQAAVGVALLETKTGRYVRINQKYSDFLGYTIEDMLHKTFHSVTYPDDVQTNLDNNALLLGGTRKEFSIEKRYIRKDGTVVWGNLTASPLWKPGIEPATHFHIAVVADITARKQAEDELRRAKTSVEETHRELEQAFAREQQLARTDALTSVNNRRYWFELAEHEFEVAARYHHPLAVILFDIDHFKLVNDTFGHAVGDQVLERVAQVARAALRSADVIGRYGGEEFVIVLPMTTAQQAYPVAERIRAGVGAIRVETAKGQAVVTLSIGIAETLLAPPGEHTGGNDSVERVIHCADEAMYTAKQAGRNRTSIYFALAEHLGESV